MNPFEKRKPIPMDRCRHIMCKGLMIYGDDYMTPEEDSDRSNDFWCMHTQKVFGPHGDLVVLNECDASRECFESL